MTDFTYPKETTMTTYTAEDFANAEFARKTYSSPAVAARFDDGNSMPWRVATGRWLSDADMATGGWVPVREAAAQQITRPALAIPDKPGERFWGNWHGQMLEFIVTDEQSALVLDGSGTLLRLPIIRDHCTVVPAPEPETVLDAVPVPAHLIREAEEWYSAPIHGTAVRIIRDIVQAVREREGES